MVITEKDLRTHLAQKGPAPYQYAEGDYLTQPARDFARERGIPLAAAASLFPDGFVDEAGRHCDQKPEHMTHLQGNLLVPKTHPRIALRGGLDTLQAALLQAQLAAHRQFGSAGGALIEQMEEVLALVRAVLACEVKGCPLEAATLFGQPLDEVKHASHNPAGGHGPPHWQMGECALALNLARALARQAELAAAAAFIHPDGRVERADLLRALNRVSSALYLLYGQSAAETARRKGGPL